MKTSTIPVTAPSWYTVDASDQTLGKVAALVAHRLRGKHKPSFSPHQLCGDQIIVLNVEKIAIHPKKMRGKKYIRHSGYLGHISVRTLEKMMEDKPEEVMRKAVYGMLPRNRLRLQMLKRVHILRGSEHRYAAQKPVPLTLDL